MVGSQAIHMEPTSKFSSDAFFGPSDPLAAIAVFDRATPNLPSSDCSPINYKQCSTIGDLSDISDTDLEKLLSPFAAASDSDYDPDYFDIESFMAA